MSGRPTGLSSSSLRTTMEAATRMVNSERLNRKRPAEDGDDESIADPGEDDSWNRATSQQMEIWKLLPHLQGLPEAMLRKLPLNAVFQLNSALAKDQKTTAKMNINTRLAANAQKLMARPSKVEGGHDNRKDILHPSRFLGGTCCANSELWQAAKKTIGEEGIMALGNYDMDSVGCGGSVTPRGWQELHNPGSQELKLKLFYLPNVANSGLSAKKVNLDGGDEALSIGESLKEIADLDSYRTALNTAREAMHSALPWNRSICAVVGFMMNTNYLQTDLGGNSRRGGILTEFTDYVFGRNALNWENGHPFLSTDDLAHVWSNWKGKRMSLFTTGSKEEKKFGNSRTEKKAGQDICRMYNAGKCRQQADKECKTPWGRTLRHVCNKYVTGGKMCEKDHPRADHK